MKKLLTIIYIPLYFITIFILTFCFMTIFDRYKGVYLPAPSTLEKKEMDKVLQDHEERIFRLETTRH